ncbi:MAG: hypothetical protein LBR58_05045 [Propionibacteriaceae bacterium]|nr:hypothetical protein [Propionibacteriaceae bacterium]
MQLRPSRPLAISLAVVVAASSLSAPSAAAASLPETADTQVMALTSTDGYTTQQGAVVHGQWAWVLQSKRVKLSSGREQRSTQLLKYRIGDENPVASRKFKYDPKTRTNTLGHANDMTYDTARKQLVVPVWDEARPANDNLVRYLDPDTLRSVAEKTVKGPAHISAICYFGGRYVAGSGTEFWRYDAELENGQRILKVSLDDTDQGIACDSEYIYLPRSKRINPDRLDNTVHVYTWEGKHVADYLMQTTWGEVEAMTVRPSDGAVFAAFNLKSSPDNWLTRVDKLRYEVRYGDTVPATVALYGQRAQLATAPAKAGQTFTGWVGGARYWPGDEVQPRIRGGHVTLRPTWMPAG